MKIFMIVCALLLVFCVNSMAVEGITNASFGAMFEKGQETVPAFAAGFMLPINRGEDSSYIVYTDIDYFYADRETDSGVTELSAIRTMVMGERTVFKSFYLGLGAGFWKFINSSGENTEHPAIRVSAGLNVWKIDVSGSYEVVRINKAPDMSFVSLNLNLLKF